MLKSPEIQGLRALSVVLVLLYHVDWLSGGFIGVDVFYVISGYLITKIIITDRDFTFKSFYSKRAKRLLPAAYLVLLFTAIAFWFTAPILSRSQFAKDLLASTWYMSNYNFAFWQNDYQNLGSNPSPLIHYWSLAVEEQFYLLWPLLLMVFKGFRKGLTLLVTLVSFTLSLVALEIFPIWSFYSLPTRAFELGIGAIFAIMMISFSSRMLSYLGILLIFGASFWFDSSTAFPGFPALIPTFASVLIVANTCKNPLLANRIAQSLGDWSYSIYLWHWPLLTIPAIALGRNLEIIEKIALLILTVILAFLTYKFVENPIRTRHFPPKKVLTGVLLSGGLLTLIAVALFQSGKSINESAAVIEMRKQPIIYADGCQLDKRETFPDPRCVYGERSAKRAVVLIGDSHAAQWFPAINKWASQRDLKLIVMTKSSCPASLLPLKDRGSFKTSICNNFRNNAFKEINSIKPVLVIAGSAEIHKTISKSAYNQFPNLNYPGAKFLVLKDTPWPNQDIPTCLMQNPDGLQCMTKAPIGVEYPGRDTFDPIPYLCKSGYCPAKVGFNEKIVAYRDHSHISVALALDLFDELSAKLDEVMAR